MSDRDIRLDFKAVQEFRAARLQANLERVFAAMTGKSAELLSYEDVREKIRAIETSRRERKDIPLDAIVGSVGRYADFTRRFLPRQESDEQRWSRVRMLVESPTGLPPIEAYQLGDVYFIIDGNHRASVARSLGAASIEGYVTQVHARVPLSPEMSPDELIIAERYARFLEKTGLSGPFPEIDLSMSTAGNYRVLEQRIWVHQQWMGTDIPYTQAAADWYQTVYWTVIQVIRRRGVMRDFPDCTETDLYVWIEKHGRSLAERLGWSVGLDVLATDITESYSRQPKRVLKRMGQKLLASLVPETLEAGPMPGEWRKIWLDTHQDERLFRHVLVALNGQEAGWEALKQALMFAQQENGRVYGLHVFDTDAHENDATSAEIQAIFEEHCQQAEITAELSFESGNIARVVCDRARWMDLVVVSLTHPPGPEPTNRLRSGFSQLLRRCPRPVLAVPQAAPTVSHLLLAYDGSPASKEAMFIAVYMARHWELPLTVVSVKGRKRADAINIDAAQQYIHAAEIQANYIQAHGRAGSAIVQKAQSHNCDLIIMGSYSLNPIMEIVFGSTVDDVLRASGAAALICR